MSMAKHVKIKCQATYAQLYNIIKIRRYIDSQSAEILIHALVHSHLDYCKSFLAGLPKYITMKLQLVQNTAARLLSGTARNEHITPVLGHLHWLPIEFRIKYKIWLLTFKAMHGLGPPYLSDMLTVRETRYSMRHNGALALDISRTNCKTLGVRIIESLAGNVDDQYRQIADESDGDEEKIATSSAESVNNSQRAGRCAT